ncbi:TetR/AcrR family transcriptional regulator [Paenibacillus sp. 1P07SE]|uniref:TetR/AcrR family transcriptional regulator n=1 Tax=Paenibacillus sp. 1P07SE TaxID=3132209 RepID=UPI0039A5B5C7
MARKINEVEHTTKRNAILDEAYRLILDKGFEQMTIQDITDALHISRGAFFHYFHSKHSLLEALLDRLLDKIEQEVTSVLLHHSPVVDKLQAFFGTIMELKTRENRMLLKLLQTWYSDGNALVRHKFRTAKLQRFTPILQDIIRESRPERWPRGANEHIGEVALSVALDLSDAFARSLLASGPDTPSTLESIVSAYTEAIERILDLPDSSFSSMNQAFLERWMAIKPEVTDE